jgi:hypothetical protein
MALPTKVLTVALPFLMKQLPKLWPLLLEAKNREKVMELASSLAKASPTRRLGIKLELTETLAQSLVANADTEAEAARARAWQKRARNMRTRLDMPIAGVKAARAHRSKLEADMNALHEEMSSALSDGDTPAT